MNGDETTYSNNDQIKTPLLPIHRSQSMNSIIESIFTLKNLFTLLGPLLCTLICLFVKFENAPSTSTNMLGVLAWIFTWWLSESVPMPITSMSPMFLFPLFGISSADDVAHSYMDDVIALVLGSFILALAVEHYNIHRRLALNVCTFNFEKFDILIVKFKLYACQFSFFIYILLDYLKKHILQFCWIRRGEEFKTSIF